MKILSNSEYNDLLKQENYYRNELKSLEKERVNFTREIEEEYKKLSLFKEREKERFEFEEKKLVAAYEDKLAKSINKLKQEHMEEMNKLRAKLDGETTQKLKDMMESNYNKLSESMTKLHEEGNATTKHMSEMTKEVLRAAGLQGANMNVKRIENVSE